MKSSQVPASGSIKQLLHRLGAGAIEEKTSLKRWRRARRLPAVTGEAISEFAVALAFFVENVERATFQRNLADCE